MNETEAAKIFNEELDALLAGRATAAPSDPGALALAGELARADFSAESQVRASLRERLLGRPAGLLEVLRGLFSNNYARAAFAAAVLAVALLPLARRQPGQAPEPALPVVTPESVAALPPLPPPARAKIAAGAPAAGAGLFAALPMPGLEAQPLKDFPIAPAGSGLPMVLAEGRPITPGAGAVLVLETESAPFPIERRPIKPGDLFERRVL